MPDQGSDLPDTGLSTDSDATSFGGRDLHSVPPLWTFDNGPGFAFQPTGGFGDHTTQAMRYAFGFDDPSGVTDPTMLTSIRQFQPVNPLEPAPGLLGSKADILAAAKTNAASSNAQSNPTGLPDNPSIGQVATDNQGVRQYFVGVDHGGNQIWNPMGVTSQGPDDPSVTETNPLVVTGQRRPGIGDRIIDTLGKSWGTINTDFGLALGGIEYGAGLLAGTHPHVGIGNNAVQFSGSPNLLHSLFPSTFGKDDVMTLGNVQIYSGKASPTDPGTNYVPGLPSIPLGKHEEAHTYQSQLLGPLYGPLWWALGQRSPSNPMERAADWYGAGQGGPFAHFWSQPSPSPPDGSH